MASLGHNELNNQNDIHQSFPSIGDDAFSQRMDVVTLFVEFGSIGSPTPQRVKLSQQRPRVWATTWARVLCRMGLINYIKHSGEYMRRWNRSLIVLLMACSLRGAMPLP